MPKTLYYVHDPMCSWCWAFRLSLNTLIEESDIILRDLSWDHLQGREYLQKEFNVSTRKELSEKQLISFVEKLKSIRNKILPQ